MWYLVVRQYEGESQEGFAADKVERLKTGGGQFVTHVTDNMKARTKKALRPTK